MSSRKSYEVLAQTKFEELPYGLTEFQVQFSAPGNDQFDEGWRDLQYRQRALLNPLGDTRSPELHFWYQSTPDRYPVTKIAIFSPVDGPMFADGEWTDCVGIPGGVAVTPNMLNGARGKQVPARRDTTFECRRSKNLDFPPIRTLAVLRVGAPLVTGQPWDGEFWGPFKVIPFDLNFSEKQDHHIYLAYTDGWASSG